jgi:hypothetical protein
MTAIGNLLITFLVRRTSGAGPGWLMMVVPPCTLLPLLLPLLLPHDSRHTWPRMAGAVHMHMHLRPLPPPRLHQGSTPALPCSMHLVCNHSPPPLTPLPRCRWAWRTIVQTVQRGRPSAPASCPPHL